MNEGLGITTLLLPASPGLTAVSSTMLRGPGAALTSGGRDQAAVRRALA